MKEKIEYLVKNYNGQLCDIPGYINYENYYHMLVYSNYYDNGFAKVYHEDNDIIALIENKIVEFTLN